MTRICAHESDLILTYSTFSEFIQDKRKNLIRRSWTSEVIKKDDDFFVPKMLGQWFGHAQGRSSLHWIINLDPFLMVEIIVKHTDTGQVRVYGLGLQPFFQKMIRILPYLPTICLLNGNIDPDHKVLKDVHVALHRVGRVVPPFQEPPVVHDHIRNAHPSLSFL